MKNNILLKVCASVLVAVLVLVSIPTYDIIAASKITLQSGEEVSSTIYVGEKYDLQVADKDVTFKSSDNRIAEITDKDGVLTCKTCGNVKITAALVKTGEVIAEKDFTVKQRATSIYIQKSQLTLSLGKTAVINASLTPSTSTDAIKFVSSDKKVATVGLNSGLVKAKAAGTCMIRVYALESKEAKLSSPNKIVCIIKVKVFSDFAVEKVSATSTSLILDVANYSKKITAADFKITDREGKAYKISELKAVGSDSVTLVFGEELEGYKTYTLTYNKSTFDFVIRYNLTEGQIPANIAPTPSTETLDVEETPKVTVSPDVEALPEEVAVTD